MCGRQYLIDHCFIVEEERQKDLSYRAYITDALKNINNSVSNAFGGTVFTKRYVEITELYDDDVEEQDPEEIKMRIKNKLDILGKD